MVIPIAPPSGFLSTLSLRRATTPASVNALILAISIHAPLAESDFNGVLNRVPTICISIHAPLAESDETAKRSKFILALFLSTLPLRRATFTAGTPLSLIFYFYPRSPCGERRRFCQVWRAVQGISIHAPLAESDSKSAQNSGVLLRI